jgi:hypothetical protein
MSFLQYRRDRQEGAERLTNTGHNFKLAGHNLIYKAWEKKNRPLNKGWHITAGQLIEILSQEKKTFSSKEETCDTLCLLIDYDPNSKLRIGLAELREIHLFTVRKNESNKAYWSPMLLKLRSVLEIQDVKNWESDKIKEQKKEIRSPKYEKEIIEFLYINGDDEGWNWGKNGMTNGALLYPDAWTYFRPLLI